MKQLFPFILAEECYSYFQVLPGTQKPWILRQYSNTASTAVFKTICLHYFARSTGGQNFLRILLDLCMKYVLKDTQNQKKCILPRVQDAPKQEAIWASYDSANHFAKGSVETTVREASLWRYPLCWDLRLLHKLQYVQIYTSLIINHWREREHAQTNHGKQHVARDFNHLRNHIISFRFLHSKLFSLSSLSIYRPKEHIRENRKA